MINNNDNSSSTKLNKFTPSSQHSSSHDWRIGTQVVDLTLSSDPIDFSMEENVIVTAASRGEDEDDEDVVDDGSSAGGSLPKGEGWVRKNNGLEKKKKKMGRERERVN